MNLFAVFAVLLIVVVSAFILPPLWLGLRAPKGQVDRKEANVAIFRDQLAELAREKSEGSLAEADFEQARHELQRRLLEEVEPADAALAAQAMHGPSRKTAIAILVLLPVFSLLGYGVLGNPTALDPVQTAAPQEMTPEKINEMVASLAEKLKTDPDNIPGWLMLARSYKSMGRYAEAVDAYSHAEKGIGEDPDQLASYAETVAMANGKGITGKAIQLVEQALKINPNHGHSLFLAGAAAMEAGQNKKGITYWEALLPQVEPGSEVDQMLQSGLAKMRAAK